MPRPMHGTRLFPIVVVLCLLLAGWPGAEPVRADEPADYAVPGRFALPWACAEAYRVTWTPDGHWAYGKASGVAYDFGLPEGTPVMAPAAGTAHFLRDDRPLETNLGYYVDLVIEGGWLVRLAHLRDEQTGQREVRAGELLGYSGRSGVIDAHLHVELLVRDGRRWARPDVGRLETLYGVPAADLAEEAVLENDRCEASLWMDGDARLDLSEPALALGEAGRLLLPIANPGYEATAVDQVAVSLRSPGGELRSVVANGLWQVGGQVHRDVAVDLLPDEAGEWRIEGVALSAEGAAWHLAAGGSFVVRESPVTLVGLSVPPVLQVGEQVRVEAWLQNASETDVDLGGLAVAGLSARGEPWEAAAHYPLTVPAGGYRRLLLESTSVPYSVGDWQVLRVDAEQGSRRLVIARVEQGFRVEGAELAIRAVEPWADPGAPGMLLLIANMGTVPICPDRLLLWGEATDGLRHVSLAGDVVGDLAPGQSRQVIVSAAEYGGGEDWQLEAAGVWCAGRYTPLRLPPRLGYTEPAPVVDGQETASGVEFG